MIHQLKPIPGFALRYRSGGTNLCGGDHLIIGPQECVTKILPFKIFNLFLASLIPKLSVPDLLFSFWIDESGGVRVRIWNASQRAQSITQKTVLLKVYSRTEPIFVNAFEAEDPLPICGLIDDKRFVSRDEWAVMFPSLFDDSLLFGGCKKLEVTHNEVMWKIPFSDIPLNNSGIEYEGGEVSPSQADEYLTVLLEKGIIRRLSPGEKAFYSPALFLRKPDGRVRKVVDYRLLNSYSKPWVNAMNGGSLSRVREIPKAWRYFSKVDLESGFSNLPIDSGLQRLFAFSHRGKTYTYKTLPQGWSCSSGLFDSRLRSIFSELEVVSYIDDLIVGGETPAVHDCLLKALFEVLVSYGFRINHKKLELAADSVSFLGFDVEPGRFSLKSYVRKQVEELPVATSLSQLRKMIGIFNFVRPFVPRLDRILSPLIDQLSLSASRRMSLPELQDLCREIWEFILTHNCDLSLFDAMEDSDWTLLVDWSSTGMGYVLLRGPLSKKCVVGIGSRRVGEPSSSHLGELRAVQWSLQAVKVITAGQIVRLLSDSSSVVARLLRDPRQSDVEDVRLARLYSWIWQNFPLNSRLSVEHYPGDYNIVADSLSRWHTREAVGAVPAVATVQEAKGPSDAVELIRSFHEEGHYNAETTYLNMKREGYNWEGLRTMVRKVVQGCQSCQRFGREVPYAHARTQGLSGVGQLVFVDFAGPYPVRYGASRRSILVMVDGFSRLVQATVVRSPNAKALCVEVESWWNRVGRIETMQADNASVFHSKVFKSWLQQRDAKIQYAGAYRPESNGVVERMIGNLKTRLCKMMESNDRSWATLLPEAVNSVNNTVHSLTKFTPNELAFGKLRSGELVEADVLRKWRMEAADNLRTADLRTEENTRGQSWKELTVGTRVWWKVPKRDRDRFWEPIWDGPWVVVAASGNVFRDIQEAEGTRWRKHVHVRDLKKYHSEFVQGSV